MTITQEPWYQTIQRLRTKNESGWARIHKLEDNLSERLERAQDMAAPDEHLRRDWERLQKLLHSGKTMGNILSDPVFLELEERYA